MKLDNVTLTDGSVVIHFTNAQNQTEVTLEDGNELNDWQWLDYVKLTTPKPIKKLTWSEIKAKG